MEKLKKVKQIFAPDDAIYMADFMKEFPNGILNKKECGVGATRLSIVNHQKYIITVPTVELIENKVHQHSGVLFGVYEGVTQKQLQEYLSTAKVPKIMVTYNSLPKLVKWLGANVYKEYRLLVDEYHCLLTEYTYRNEAINGVLEESLKFDHKCFVSATPITADFCPPQLENLDNYEIIWKSTTRIIPVRRKTNKPFQMVVNLIKKYKAGNYSMNVILKGEKKVSKEAYFFINSVKAIVDIMENAGLTDNEVKIICSDTERNRLLLKDWSISKVSDPNRPFTFITSRAFLGADFYSETGIVYIVSSVKKANTLLDIGTVVYQISGRIRNIDNPFKNWLIHIYNTGLRDVSKEKFEQEIQQRIKDSKNTIEFFNNGSVEQRQSILKLLSLNIESNYTFYNKKTGLLEFNDIKRKSDKFEYSVVHETYKNGLSIRDAYLKAGFDMSEAEQWHREPLDFIEGASRMNFQNTLDQYMGQIDCESNPECAPDKDFKDSLIRLYPEIKEMVDTLGTSKIRSIGLNKKSISKYLYNVSSEATTAVKKSLMNTLKLNTVYKSDDVKNELLKIYSKLKIDKKCKATDLEQFFKIDKKNRSIQGKVYDSIIITDYNEKVPKNTLTSLKLS